VQKKGSAREFGITKRQMITPLPVISTTIGRRNLAKFISRIFPLFTSPSSPKSMTGFSSNGKSGLWFQIAKIEPVPLAFAKG